MQIAEDTVRRWHGAASGRVRVAVSPTIPGQCSEAFFAGCVRLAREYDVGLHTHLAESKVQAIASQQRWGTTLVGASPPSVLWAHTLLARTASGSLTTNSTLGRCWPGSGT